MITVYSLDTTVACRVLLDISPDSLPTVDVPWGSRGFVRTMAPGTVVLEYRRPDLHEPWALDCARVRGHVIRKDGTRGIDTIDRTYLADGTPDYARNIAPEPLPWLAALIAEHLPAENVAATH